MKIRKRIVIFHEKKLFLQKIASEQHRSLSETVIIGLEAYFRHYKKSLEEIREFMKCSPSLLMIGEIRSRKDFKKKLREKILDHTKNSANVVAENERIKFIEVEDPPEFNPAMQSSLQLNKHFWLSYINGPKTVLNIYLDESEYARLQSFCNENTFKESTVLHNAVFDLCLNENQKNGGENGGTW